MKTRRGLAVALALLLAATACGDDADSDVATDDTTTTESTDDGNGATTTGEEDSNTTQAPQDLPASFRGVTADSILVGVAVPDFEALQAAGIANYQGDADIAFQAFFDIINDEGGIAGRMIEPVYVPFDFVDPETQDAACVELTEDNEVFIVLYGLLGQGNLCLTELHDTMVMTRSFQTTAFREASGDTLWLQLNASDDERARIMGQALAESGRLDGRTVGILAPALENDGAEGRLLQDTLTEVGIDSTLLLTEAPAGDSVATEAELQRHAERFQVEGVDFVFELQGGGNVIDIWASIGFTPETAHKNLGASIDGAADRSVMDGALGVGEINEQAILDDPGFRENCVDVVASANPELVDEMSVLATGDQQLQGIPSWVNPIMIACDQTMLLKRIGEIAGVDLTNDSFRAALDELGPVELHGYGQASFDSETKWDGLDEFYIQEYDAATDKIEVVGDPIVVDR